MSITKHESASDFLQSAGGMLEAHEAANNLILGLAGRYVNEPADKQPVMLTIGSGDDCVAAALVTSPGRPAILYTAEDSPVVLDALLEVLLSRGQPMAGAVIPSRCAQTLCRLWQQRTAQTLAPHRSLRAFELRQVIFPQNVPGRALMADDGDLDVVADWLARFGREVAEPGDAESARKTATRRIADRDVLLWENDAVLVSQALRARVTRRGACIAGVYTPPEHRGHGYASAVVAALSQRLLDEGHEFVCLYTDRNSPGPNRIYPRLGYRPVMDWEHLTTQSEPPS